MMWLVRSLGRAAAGWEGWAQAKLNLPPNPTQPSPTQLAGFCNRGLHCHVPDRRHGIPAGVWSWRWAGQAAWQAGQAGGRQGCRVAGGAAQGGVAVVTYRLLASTLPAQRVHAASIPRRPSLLPRNTGRRARPVYRRTTGAPLLLPPAPQCRPTCSPSLMPRSWSRWWAPPSRVRSTWRSAWASWHRSSPSSPCRCVCVGGVGGGGYKVHVGRWVGARICGTGTVLCTAASSAVG